MSQGHHLSLTVQTASMWPLLDIGDVIICAPINLDETHINRLVVYHLNNQFIVHRLKRIDFINQTFTTAPDNGLNQDKPVKHDCIIGVVKSRVRNGNSVNFFTSQFKIYNTFLFAIAKICVYARHLKPKIVDWFVSASEESLRQRIGKWAYMFALYLFFFISKIFKINGFITRSAAINEIIAARSDIDCLVVTENIEDTLRVAKLIKVVRKLCPVISYPAILQKNQFANWAKFGGPLRLESNSWRPFGNINKPKINFEDVYYQRALLRGALEVYKNLWSLAVELSMPKTVYHSKNISNFHKFCIDAIRWISILENQTSTECFKIKRRDFQKTHPELINSICQDPNLINFISSQPLMESSGRAEQAMLYFDTIAKKLIKACTTYNSTSFCKVDCNSKEDSSNQFKIYDFFDSNILLKHVVSPEACKIPVTEIGYSIFINTDSLHKFIYDSQNPKSQLTELDFNNALAELCTILSYYSEHLDVSNLQIIACNIIRVVYKAELGNSTDIMRQCGNFVRTRHPNISTLLISSTPEKFNYNFRLDCFRTLNDILNARINLNLI